MHLLPFVSALALAALLPGAVSPQSPPAAQNQAPAPPGKAADDTIQCVITLAVSAKKPPVKKNIGDEKHPVNVIELTLRARTLAVRPLDPARKDICNPDGPPPDTEEDVPIYFQPAQISDLHVPSKIEVVITQVQVGFAYYGIPNPIFFTYLKTLP